MVHYNEEQPRNIDKVEDMLIASRDAQRELQTDFGSDKSSRLNIQFKADSSYGLTKQRYGWYSNGTQFDGTFFSQVDGLIKMETSATSGNTARIRSAYPGRYIPHTAVEAGAGARIPSTHLQYDSNNNVSLTHGEISIDVLEWDRSIQGSRTSVGFSFEPDGTYIQIRKDGANEFLVHQSDWNVDPMDGTGPSGEVLEPDDGLIYNIGYSWYGFGNFYFQIYSKEQGWMETVHVVRPEGGPAIDMPNMPIGVTLENKDTAEPLAVEVGGMSFITHGGGNLDQSEAGRTLEIARHTTNTFIDTQVTINNGSVDPFAEAGVPMLAIKRDTNDLDSRTSLGIDVLETFPSVTSDVYVMFWDEYDDSALTGANFRTPDASDPPETRLLVDTESTAYTPSSDASLRALTYTGADQKGTKFEAGSEASRLPLEATLVVTVALAPGVNATDAQPLLTEVRETW